MSELVQNILLITTYLFALVFKLRLGIQSMNCPNSIDHLKQQNLVLTFLYQYFGQVRPLVSLKGALVSSML